MDQTKSNNLPGLPGHFYFNKMLVKMIVIIVVLLVVFLLTIYLIMKNSKVAVDNLNTNTKVIAATIPQEPATIYRRGCTVVQEVNVTTYYVSCRVRSTSNNPDTAFETRQFTLTGNANTKFFKRDYRGLTPTSPMPAQQASNRLEVMVPGNYVNVTATANLKGLAEFGSFLASQVEWIIK